MRLVLDTNVLLDWLVFRDPGVDALARALATGHAVCVSNEACLDELRRVLARPRFKLDGGAQAQCLAQYRRCAESVQPNAAVDLASLPQCSDRDDQKFLDLARLADADCLVTKDKALLKLRRGVLRSHALRIVTPAELARLLVRNLAPTRAP